MRMIGLGELMQEQDEPGRVFSRPELIRAESGRDARLPARSSGRPPLCQADPSAESGAAAKGSSVAGRPVVQRPLGNVSSTSPSSHSVLRSSGSTARRVIEVNDPVELVR